MCDVDFDWLPGGTSEGMGKGAPETSGGGEIKNGKKAIVHSIGQSIEGLDGFLWQTRTNKSLHQMCSVLLGHNLSRYPRRPCCLGKISLGIRLEPCRHPLSIPEDVTQLRLVAMRRRSAPRKPLTGNVNSAKGPSLRQSMCSAMKEAIRKNGHFAACGATGFTVDGMLDC
jgi:hypothetical protein